MIKKTKNIISLWLVAITVFSMTACINNKNEEINSKNIEKYLPQILENQIKIENIYRGIGLLTKDAQYVADSNGQCFVEVTEKDFATMAMLKEQTEKVYTKEYAEENFYKFAFDKNYARYKEVDGKLCSDIGIGGALDRQWSPETFKVISEDDNTITISVEYMNYNSVFLANIIFLKSDGKLIIDKLLENQ